MSSPGKYDALSKFLNNQDKTEQTIHLSFKKIEGIINEPLPPSARKYSAWWGNDAKTHPQGQSWVEAGWKVDGVDLSNEQVTLIRA